MNVRMKPLLRIPTMLATGPPTPAEILNTVAADRANKRRNQLAAATHDEAAGGEIKVSISNEVPLS